MLIIANGTFKSGSTWQRDILKHFIEHEEIPKKFQDKKNKTFLSIKKLKMFIQSDIFNQKNFIAKAHIYHKTQIELLKNEPDVYVFMIKRDLRDSIVSHYHHFKNIRKVNLSFRLYYWLIGRFKALQIIKYNNNWDINANNVFHSTFEDLKKDFNSEVLKYATFLNININKLEVDKIKEETNINKIKAKSERKWFFRKGDIGDYENYFTKQMLNDLSCLENKFGLFERIIFFFFETRVFIKRLFN